MKKLYYLSAIAAAIAAVSCVQEEAPVDVPQEGTGEAVVFSATFSEKPDSKATLTEGAEKSVVSWEANDEVVIFEGTKSFTYVATPDEENAKNATLAPETESVASADGEHYALFLHPSGNAEGTLEGNVITTTLPAVQIAEPNTFATHLAVAKTTGTSFSFKNVCGLVRVEIKTSDVKSVVLEGLNGETVAGGIKVTVADAPTWAVDGDNGSKTVTLKAAGEGTAIAPGVYFFAVLPQTFENGFKVTTNKLSGDPVVRTTAAGVTVERCDIVKGNANGIAGKGTEADPYVIMTAQDMCDMKALTTPNQMTYFKLGDDIDMASVDTWETVNGKSPYNRYVHFDGAEHTISNFKPTNITGGYPSIFGVFNGTIQNVNIEDVNIINSVSLGVGVIGGSAGTCGADATDQPESLLVSNVHVTGSLTNSDVPEGTDTPTAGGLFGRLYGVAQVVDCSSNVVINSDERDNGGLIGRMGAELTMSRCTVNVTLNLTRADMHRTGGLIGIISGTDAEISECTAEGTINDNTPGVTKSRAVSLGGLIGHNNGTGKTTIKNCSSAIGIETEYGASCGGLIGICGKGTIEIEKSYATGKISGTTNLGGVVGIVEPNAKVSFKDSYSESEISGAGHYCGGFAGWIQSTSEISMTNCYATGNVKSTGSSIAGLVGGAANKNDDNLVGAMTMVNCYATGTVQGNNNVGGLIGNRGGGGKMTGCYYKGTIVKGAATVGGLVGNLQKDGDIVSCYSECTVTATGNNVGGLIGSTTNKGKFDQCYHKGEVSTSGDYSGGLIGYLVNKANIIGCYNDGIVGGKNYVGGLVGSLNAGGDFVDCHNEGNITGASLIGGLVGNFNTGGIVKNCHSTGTLTSTLESGDVQIGGLVGNGYPTAFESCSAECDIVCKGIYAGGIVGYQRGPVTVEKCSFEGTITSGTRHAGGIVGRSNGVTTIRNCSASASLGVSDTWAGGIIAYAAYNVTVEDCYSNCTVTGGKSVGGIMGQCTKVATFDSCIAWGTVSASDATSGAIIGAAGAGSTTPGCYYNPTFTPAAGATGLHGTAAPAGSTISSLATTLGWDTTIWDLTGDVPVLK